jgi:cytochrome c oxidase cbb3-type subunit III
MSDFVHTGWAWYVGVTTLLGLVACVWVLWMTSRYKAVVPNSAVNDNTTGHVWDEDLRELNNPLPMWWMVLFMMTIVVGGGYLVLFPGLGSYRGTNDWSQIGQYEAEMKEAEAKLAPLYARFTPMSTEQLARDTQAMGIGERLFANNCSTCHGSDARGSRGFPDLTDADWLWGGEPEQIVHSITKGRVGNMPPMAAAVGGAEDIGNLAQYVLSLSGSSHSDVKAHLGRPKFTACAACHGAKGEGNPALGAPRLSDRVWLHGWGPQAIADAVQKGRSGTMPAHEGKLTPAQIKILSAYVWRFSNGGAPGTTTTASAAPVGR